MLEVKGKIESAHGFAVAQQKLIHAGKVLKDESPLSEYNVKENDFLVVMVTKVRAMESLGAVVDPDANTDNTLVAQGPSRGSGGCPRCPGSSCQYARGLCSGGACCPHPRPCGGSDCDSQHVLGF